MLICLIKLFKNNNTTKATQQTTHTIEKQNNINNNTNTTKYKIKQSRAIISNPKTTVKRDHECRLKIQLYHPEPHMQLLIMRGLCATHRTHRRDKTIGEPT